MNSLANLSLACYLPLRRQGKSAYPDREAPAIAGLSHYLKESSEKLLQVLLILQRMFFNRIKCG
jgi:hypothetical protein